MGKNLDVITTIPKKTLKEQIAPLVPGKLAAVEPALAFALGLRGVVVRRGRPSACCDGEWCGKPASL